VRRFIILVISAWFLLACAGRDPKPVQVVRESDKNLSCDMIQKEQRAIRSQITGLAKDADKNNKNVALAIAGAYLLVPYFFMDLSEAEKVEVNALRARGLRLMRLEELKGCEQGVVNGEEAN